MKNRWSDDVVTLLRNWAMWVVSTKGGDMSPFPAYNLAPPGKRAGSEIPMFTGDAEDADQLITAMSHRYQHPLRVHYLWPNTSDALNAKRCNCSLNTYKTRLDDAHAMFSSAWYARRIKRGTASAGVGVQLAPPSRLTTQAGQLPPPSIPR